jgi:hypothetical protein
MKYTYVTTYPYTIKTYPYTIKEFLIMNLQEFKYDFENKLKDKIHFDLQEFHYLPYAFGHGILAYRINGYNYKFIYDGRDRDNTLLCERSSRHEKYANSNWYKQFEQIGMVLTDTQIQLIIADNKS